MSKPTYYLFPNGTSYMDWRCQNCDRCWKGPTPNQEGRNHKCAIETAISMSMDGTLQGGGITSPEKAAKLAARLGWDGINYLYKPCPERQEKRPNPKTRIGERQRKDQPQLL